MADNGYYQSVHHLRAEAARSIPGRWNVLFHVAPGELARVGKVTIEGDTGIAPEQIQQITKLKPGAKVKSENLTRALERLRKHYQKNQHLEAQVSLTERDYHADTNTLDYIFEVEQGSKVVITAEGAKIRGGEMKKLVPVYQENSVDDDLLNEGRRNLRNYLQTKGYFDARSRWNGVQSPTKTRSNIVYKIDQGERHELAAIKIDGQQVFRQGHDSRAPERAAHELDPDQRPLQPADDAGRCGRDQGAVPGQRISGCEGRCQRRGQLRVARQASWRWCSGSRKARRRW